MKLDRLLSIGWFFFLVSLGTSMSGMEIFASLLTFIFLVTRGKEIFSTRFWLRPSFSLPILLFTFVVIMGVLVNPAGVTEKLYDLRRLRFLLFYFVLFHLLESHPKKNTFWVVPLLSVSVFVIIYGFFQHFIGVDWFRPEGKKIVLYALSDVRVGPLVIGTFNHHLTFSNVYTLVASVFVGLGLFSTPRRPIFILVGALVFLMVLWTQSRIGWVSVGIATILFAAFWRRTAAIYAALAFGFILGGMYISDSGFRGRLERTFRTGDTQYSPDSRIHLWKANWELFKGHPLLGVGYNNNERHSKEIVDRLYPASVETNFYGHAHSNFLQLLATTGLLGLLAFVWIWIDIFRKILFVTRKNSSNVPLALGLFVGFVLFHIQGFTQWNFGDAEVIYNLIFWWAVTGAVLPEPVVSPLDQRILSHRLAAFG